MMQHVRALDSTLNSYSTAMDLYLDLDWTVMDSYLTDAGLVTTLIYMCVPVVSQVLGRL